MADSERIEEDKAADILASMPADQELPAEDDLEQSPRVSRVKSKASSVQSCRPIPRRQRRGLLARYTLIAEVNLPYLYKRRTKWLVTLVVSLAGAAAPVGSASLIPALPLVAEHFHTSDTVTNLATALYLLAMSIFPLWWSSFSETTGRRTIYVLSFALFTIFAVLSAISTNIAMLIVMRLLSGGAAASVQAVGAGTIADIWEVRERGRAMGIFYLGPLCGPLLAPIIGGALAEGYGWRATQWFLVVYGGVMWLALTLFLPETLAHRKPLVSNIEDRSPAEAFAGAKGDEEKKAPGSKDPNALQTSISLHRTTTTRSVAQTTKTGLAIFKRFFIDPLKILLLIRFPAVALTVYYAAIAFGSLYVLNISIELTFSRAPYNFSTIIIGLLYIPNSLGYFAASLLGGPWLDYIMKREAKRAGRIGPDGKLIYRPEDRMRENAWLASLMFPAALLWYGWTVEEGVHWIVPMLANFFFGVGSMLIFGMVTTMLTEMTPRRASSSIALNNFVRNIFSCVGTIVAAPIINAIGNGWLFTILGIVSLVSGALVIWAMRKYSPRWRLNMASLEK